MAEDTVYFEASHIEQASGQDLIALAKDHPSIFTPANFPYITQTNPHHTAQLDAIRDKFLQAATVAGKVREATQSAWTVVARNLRTKAAAAAGPQQASGPPSAAGPPPSGPLPSGASSSAGKAPWQP